MQRSTPVSTSKSAALSRVLGAVTHGYTRLCTGSVPPEKLAHLALRFHDLYGIAETKGRRVQRQQAGVANTQLAVYRPRSGSPLDRMLEGERLPWILVATDGTGVEAERWTSALDRPCWLGYQLCRHNDAGRVRWTWRLPPGEMKSTYAELTHWLTRHRYDEVSALLMRESRRPGFHGVRTQYFGLVATARQGGFVGDAPAMPFLQKIRHGEPLLISAP
jgi:hypothetical protein